MSDNTRMQTTRERDALHARICFHGRAAGESELIDRWWSQTGSNRRPPACKAGALPTELWPRSGISRQISGIRNDRVSTTDACLLTTDPRNWWAWVDSNYRPHPYQGCALTN